MKLLFGIVILLCCRLSLAQDIPDYSKPGFISDTSTSFILAGDVQLQDPILECYKENNVKAVEALFKRMAYERPGFVVLLGDLTFSGRSETLWQRFDLLAAPLRDSIIPVFPVMGNHEYFGMGGVGEIYRQYVPRFPQIRTHLWYMIVWQGIGIVVLNSNFSNLSDTARREQSAWYAHTLTQLEADPSIHGIIVCCHHPPYTNSTVVHDDLKVRSAFADPFSKTGKGILFITGHCHSYEHFVIEGKTFLVSGGGGPRQQLGPPGDPVKVDKSPIQTSLRPHHFCRVVREGKKLDLYVEGVSEDLHTWSTIEKIELLK